MSNPNEVQVREIDDSDVPYWGIYDLDSKPDDSLLELPRDSEGYYLDIDGNRTSFDGNRELRPAYNKLPLNDYHIQEIIKCRNDLRYFLYNYIKVLTPKGYAKPEIRSYQERFLKALLTNNRVLLLSSRQSGKSVTVGIKYLWDVNFYNNVPVGIAANVEKGSIEVLDKIKKMFNKLPIWMQQGVIKWNVKSVELENESKLITSATNGDSFRGFSLAGGNGHGGLYVDECAFIRSKTWDEFSDSVLPTVSSDKKSNIVLTSTSNGFNHWYDYIYKARTGKGDYINMEMNWYEVPGRDEAWRQSVIDTEGLIFFNQNYGNAFLGSSQTLISTDALTWIQSTIKEPIESNKALRVYEKPQKGTKYLITVDLAAGNGFGDSHAVNVIKLNKKTFRQVAVFHTNDVPVIQMTNVIYELGKLYNDAYILFEINYGEEIANRMYYDIEYDNLLTVAVNGTKQKLLGFKGRFQCGFKTTKATKPQMLVSLKTLIEARKLEILDNQTKNEFFTFIQKGGSYEAEEGSHDDLCMSLGLLGWLVNQEQFKEIIEYDFIEDYTSQVSTEDILPASMFADHHTEELEYFGDEYAIKVAV